MCSKYRIAVASSIGNVISINAVSVNSWFIGVRRVGSGESAISRLVRFPKNVFIFEPSKHINEGAIFGDSFGLIGAEGGFFAKNADFRGHDWSWSSHRIAGSDINFLHAGIVNLLPRIHDNDRPLNARDRIKGGGFSSIFKGECEVQIVVRENWIRLLLCRYAHPGSLIYAHRSAADATLPKTSDQGESGYEESEDGRVEYLILPKCFRIVRCLGHVIFSFSFGLFLWGCTCNNQICGRWRSSLLSFAFMFVFAAHCVG